MANIIVDGNEIEIEEAGPLNTGPLNGIQAAARAGVEIPHYCWHPGLSVVASCRMCLVEAGRKDPDSGEISMVPKLVPACQTPAVDGTVFVTNSEKVQQARAIVEEDLLIRHPIDCPICDKAGECHLQDYHFQHGRDERRADIKPFTSRRRELGDTVSLFVDRCVMCSRCVRFTREVSGTSELMVVNRGAHEEIDVFPGFPLDNKMSGNVVDLCPVGALGDRDFLYTQRVWFMKARPHVCAGCSTGCSIQVEENQDRIFRIKPRENLAVNQWWMCDEGRYGWKHVHDSGRCTTPQMRDRSAETYINLEWSPLADRLGSDLKAAGRLAGVLSPNLTVEAAYLLALYLRSIDPQAILALGPVPSDGDDETFANGFTIRAEKAPNRRGIEQVIRLFSEQLLTWEQLRDGWESQSIAGLWVTGGYKTDWNDSADVTLFDDLDLLVVQDLFPSPLWDRADFRLPCSAFPEREGSYVNHAERLQSFRWAVRPPGGVLDEAQLFWRMLGRTGLYRGPQVLQEIAAKGDYFRAVADGVPDDGIDLTDSKNQVPAGAV